MHNAYNLSSSNYDIGSWLQITCDNSYIWAAIDDNGKLASIWPNEFISHNDIFLVLKIFDLGNQINLLCLTSFGIRGVDLRIINGNFKTLC